MGEFLRLKPPTFAGSSNPLDADVWLRTVKRKLEAIGFLENQRIHLVAHQLSGMAYLGGILSALPSEMLPGQNLKPLSESIMCP
jgi:hypothetical protein